MFLGVMWKRVTWQGGLASIFSGTLFGVLFLTVTPFKEAIVGTFTGPAIPASIIALVCAVVVSLMTHNETLSDSERMAKVLEARGEKA
jgi:SSS family solute:Na+ symporter